MKLSIPQPCPVKWDGMTPAGEGRYCFSCEKVVIDFSTWNDKELKDFFREQKNKSKTCGRFKNYQLGSANLIQRTFYRYYLSAEKIRRRSLRKTSLFLLGVWLTLLGCRPNKALRDDRVGYITDDEQKNPAKDTVINGRHVPSRSIDTRPHQ